MTPRALHVVKAGSATLARGTVWAEVAEIARRGAQVLLVAGGAEAIRRHYAGLGRPEPMLHLGNGDEVRWCPAVEMPHVVAAYEQVALPAVRAGLQREGLRVAASVAARDDLVVGSLNRPLRVPTATGSRVVRDHRAGTVRAVDVPALRALLDAYDVVCLSPPVAADDGGTPLNVDADLLAAGLCTALDADHLRLVTGTPGLLRDPQDPTSTLRHLHRGGAGTVATGRMRQKVRAAELALDGTADVAITGPHTLRDPGGWTRWWAAEPPAADLTLLSRAVQIPSVSGDERPLADYLVDWCAGAGIPAHVDAVGNLVAVRGDGPNRLLLLGHLDTVPHRWPVRWAGDAITGRGSVDAKGCLAAFLETLARVDVPAGAQLRVVGAVEEEVSSSAGAFHVRDSYPADAVVVGEPSGADALTLGYFGLLKLRVTATVPVAHSAGRDAVSAPDALIRSLDTVRARVLAEAPAALSAVIDVRCAASPREATATGTLNFRVPPGADVARLLAAATADPPAGVGVRMLRATPGHAGGRANPLVTAFGRAFGRAGVSPRHLVKKGTSDMNTLATTWRSVPMVAYGPGDARLDHTDREELPAAEYRRARDILTDAVQTWLDTAAGAAPAAAVAAEGAR